MMIENFLQIATNSTEGPTVVDHLIGSWFIWGPIIGFLLFILKAGTNVREWIHLFREIKEEATVTKVQKKIEKSIVREIRDARNVINKQVGFEVFPLDLDIRWSKADKSKVDIDKEENKVIAILQKDDTSSESFARTAYFYSQKGLIPDLKKHFPLDYISSIDLIMAKKIINVHRPDAIQFFEDEIFKKESKDGHIKFQCRALGTLDDRGEFTRVLLRELFDIGNRLETIVPSKWTKQELKDLMNYLYAVGNRKTNEKIINPPVEGNYVRFAVCYVAIDWGKDNFKSIIRKPETSPHVKFIKELIQKDIYSIWLLSSGKDNVKFAKWLLKYFPSFSQVVSAKPFEYKHPYSQQPSIVGHIELKRKIT